MTIANRLNTTAAALATSLLILGCSAQSDAPDTMQSEGASPALPADHPPIPQGGGAQATGVVSLGVVEERMDGGGYTYARLTVDGGEIWTAGPVTALSVGDTVALVDPMPMENFPSKALDRTFDVLYFVGGYQAMADVPGRTEGEVLQVLHSAGYTYLEVEVDGEPIWVAAPEVAASEGDQVVWQAGEVMQNFPSRTLDRTFEAILFVQGVTVVR